jgi:DNA-binding SARP family transcriptional activator
MEQLRLLTFGGLNLLVGGQTMTGSTTRRRRLALLALLAVARNRGLNRDKVQAYLWPESDTERARHGLNQLVYFQRRHLDSDELFLGKKTLRLNRAVITTDVWEFEDAVDAGAHEAAVRLYSGAFLDGFFLRGAPGFERWADDQRTRLAGRCAQALGALATAAAATGDHHQAVAWWRRAAELNPFDTDTVLGLTEAYAAMGDRAAAVRHAQQHEDLLRTELGLAPDPRVVRMIEQLRSGSALGSPPTAREG